jgi:hypothetical protein
MNLSRHFHFAALILAAGPASASTWIVDDDGGPGVDFTTIAAAEAASIAGDVILVRPGNYAGFTLDAGVAILGDTGASITTALTIQGVPAGARATLAGFSTRGIRVQSCVAPVLLEDLIVRADVAAQLGSPNAVVAIAGSADVRLRGVDVATTVAGQNNQPIHGVTISSSRAELSQCSVSAARGVSCTNYVYEGAPCSGGDGVRVNGDASLRLAGTSCRGGNGGGSQGGPGICAQWGQEDGGCGVRILDSCDAIVSGLSSHSIEGGLAALGSSCGEDGVPGSGVIVLPSAALRFSGAIPVGQAYYPGCGGTAPAIDGPYVQPPVADPIVTFTGIVRPGGSITYTIHGAPGAHARLRVGNQLAVTDVAAADEDLLLVPRRTYDLGTLSAVGTASFTIGLPPTLQRGMLLVAQGSVESPGGALALTHSLPTTLR